LVFAGFEHTPVAGSHVPATWHWLCAVHTMGLLPTHVPPEQLELCVHALPSLHAVPLAAGGFEHTPVAGLHTPATWHWLCAVHTIGLLPTHVPPEQLELCVHALPSLHAVPFGFGGLTHAPVAGSHVPAFVHWPPLHATGTPVQAPKRQTSEVVQRLPSSHAVPSALDGLEQSPVPGSHTPTA
jgi:hypothetical protein